MEGKPTKEEYAVAKFLRFNVPAREGKFHNMEVHCFFASAAIDALMESKWSASKNPKDPLFINRNSCISYCQRLLQKGLFHRAEKVQRKKDKDRGDKSRKKKGKEPSEKEETGTGDELRERKSKKKSKKEKEESSTEKEQVAEKETDEKKEDKKDEGKKKKEKRLKLVMTDDQRFIDGEENIYVWIYDPVHAKTLVIGSLIVLGAIALCLFPLWPEEVRIGVYYVSLAAAGFVGFILSLVVVRLILFCVIWLLTIGRHRFWLLPNLTEDVGFFESFRPLYKHDTVAKDSQASDTKKSSKSDRKSDQKGKSKEKEKEKLSDQEESGSEEQIGRAHV